MRVVSLAYVDHDCPEAKEDTGVVVKDVPREWLLFPVPEPNAVAVWCAAKVDDETEDDQAGKHDDLEQTVEEERRW